MKHIPEDKLRQICSGIDGRYGLYVSLPDEGEVLQLHSDTVLYAASTIKIPILALLLKDSEAGYLDLYKPLPLSAHNRVGGSGVLKLLSHEVALSLYDYAVLMIVLSDNCATNQIIDVLGIDRINAFLRDNGWADTHLSHKMMSPKPRLPDGTEDMNRTSAKDLGNMMERILKEELVSAQASRMMLQIMAAQQVGKFDKALPVIKHKDPMQPLPPVPEGAVYVANKGGTFQGRALHDAAILLLPNGKRAVLVLTTNPGDSEKTMEIFKAVAKTLYESLL